MNNIAYTFVASSLVGSKLHERAGSHAAEETRSQCCDESYTATRMMSQRTVSEVG